MALAPLARGEIADLLVTDDSGARLWDLLDQGKRVRVILPVEKHPYIAPIIGRLVLAQFTAAVLDGTCGPGRHKVALVDEARHFITPTAVGGMAQARANGGCYVCAVQDLAQIADPTLRAQFRAVCGNVVLMPGLDKEDGDTYSATFPSGERLFISHSTTSGSSTSRTDSTGSGSHHTGSSRQQSHGNSTASSAASGETRQVRERRDWLAGEIRYLPQGHFLIERRDDRGTMTPPTVVAVSHTLAAACRRDQQIGASLRGPARPSGLPPIALIPAPAAVLSPPTVASSLANPIPAAVLPPPDAEPPAAGASHPPLPPPAPPAVALPTPETLREEPEPPIEEPPGAEVTDEMSAQEPDPPGSASAAAATGPEPPPSADTPVAAGPSAPPNSSAPDLAVTLCTALLLDYSSAALLITQAYDQGWTNATIQALLTEVQADPRVTQPAAVFKRRILANKPPVG